MLWFFSKPILLIEMKQLYPLSCYKLDLRNDKFMKFGSVPKEDSPNTEFFLFRIFLYSDWIQENTDQKKPPCLDTFHAVKGRRYRDLIIWDLRLDICIAQWLKFFQQKFLVFFLDLDYLHGKTGIKVEPKVQTLGPSFFHKNSNPSKIFK